MDTTVGTQVRVREIKAGRKVTVFAVEALPFEESDVGSPAVGYQRMRTYTFAVSSPSIARVDVAAHGSVKAARRTACLIAKETAERMGWELDPVVMEVLS